MRKKGKFVIAGVLILGIIVSLTYAGIRDTRQYYLTPSEIVGSDRDLHEEGLRLGGVVVDGSIDWDAQKLELSFKVGDGKAVIPVTYTGTIPDAFENGVEIVVEGRYARNGIFEADVLLPKCPSKYEPKD